MKKIISLILAFLCASMLTGCNFGINFVNRYGNYADASKYSVGDFTYNAKDVNTVEINWVGGEIEIVQSENATLSVTENGETLDSEEQMHYYIRNGKLIIHYCESGHFGEINSAKKKLRVEIPEGAELDIDNVSADITLGEINVSDFELTNVSGDVTFAGITAKDIDIEIVSGKIDAKSVCARTFSVNGVSGNINAAKIDADEIDIEIVSGKTELVLARACEVDISGVSGNVKITLPEGIGTEVELDSASGNLHSDRDYTKKGDTYFFGGGEAKIDVETVSGELYIY